MKHELWVRYLAYRYCAKKRHLSLLEFPQWKALRAKRP